MAARSDLKTTPLTDWHRDNGAKMVEFAGFEMPVQYAGVLMEHEAVRDRVGLFDITHMGEIEVRGGGAEAWLDGLVTNRIAGIPAGKVVYTAMCRKDGGVLDDMLIYRLGAERWLVVCNASNHDKIARWLRSRLPASGVVMDDVSDATALVAVQGPDSRELVGRLGRLAGRSADLDALDFYTAFLLDGPQGEWIVSRTGYTGEHGYELYLPNADAPGEPGGDVTTGANVGTGTSTAGNSMPPRCTTKANDRKAESASRMVAASVARGSRRGAPRSSTGCSTCTSVGPRNTPDGSLVPFPPCRPVRVGASLRAAWMSGACPALRVDVRATRGPGTSSNGNRAAHRTGGAQSIGACRSTHPPLHVPAADSARGRAGSLDRRAMPLPGPAAADSPRRPRLGHADLQRLHRGPHLPPGRGLTGQFRAPHTGGGQSGNRQRGDL